MTRIVTPLSLKWPYCWKTAETNDLLNLFSFIPENLVMVWQKNAFFLMGLNELLTWRLGHIHSYSIDFQHMWTEDLTNDQCFWHFLLNLGPQLGLVENDVVQSLSIDLGIHVDHILLEPSTITQQMFYQHSALSSNGMHRSKHWQNHYNN